MHQKAEESHESTVNTHTVQERMRDVKIPGVSIAILQNQTISSTPLGQTADLKPSAVTSETTFGAASLSKPVFAYLVLKLIELNKTEQAQPGAGKFKYPFDLQTPLYTLFRDQNGEELPDHENPFLKKFDFSEIEFAKKINAELVLSHRTGLQIVDNIPFKFQFDPGSHYAYSGPGIECLQDAIEELTDTNIGILAQKNIFSPMHLDHTSYGSEPKAANSLITTAEDYMTFIRTWTNDDSLNYAFRPVRPEYSMHDDYMPQSDKCLVSEIHLSEQNKARVTWGLGVGLVQDDRGQIIAAYHTGDMDEWRSGFGIELDSSGHALTGSVYLSNSHNGHVLAESVLPQTLEPALDYFCATYGFARNPEELDHTDFHGLNPAILKPEIQKIAYETRETISEQRQIETPSHSVSTLQSIADIGHIPAVSYAHVETQGEDSVVRTSLAVGKKNAKADDKTNEVDDHTQFPASSLSKIMFTYLVLQLAKREYNFELMSSLDDMNSAKEGTIYLSENPKAYFVKGMEQVVFLPEHIDLTNLEQKIIDTDFKKTILAITSNAGHTPDIHFDLDKPLHDILPYEKFLVDGQYPQKAKELTARHVLSHTTGLPNFGPTPSTTLKFNENSELGEGYSYSGESFLYLQRVIETQTGKDLETLAQDHVFKPLGMERTTFLPPTTDDNIVDVHTELGTPTAIYVCDPPLNAASSLSTTGEDFSKFMAAWIENMDDPIIKQAFEPMDEHSVESCGLGWHLYRNKDEVFAYQFGSNPNTRAFVAINITQRKGAAFFTNSENGMSIANQIFSSPDLAPIGHLQGLFEDLRFTQSDEPGWQETISGKIAEAEGRPKEARYYFEKACELAPQDESKQKRLDWFDKVHTSSREQEFVAPLQVFSGNYQNNYNDNIEVLVRGDSLILREFDQEKRFIRISENEFLPEKDQSFKIRFDGNQMSISYVFGGPNKSLSTVPTPKIQPKEASTPEQMQRQHDLKHAVSDIRTECQKKELLTSIPDVKHEQSNEAQDHSYTTPTPFPIKPKPSGEN